ncbi:MAG: diguanylate cyclase [Nitrososphaerales archaeon]
MPLNEWNQMFREIYYEKNLRRGAIPLLLHMFEVYSALGTSFVKQPIDFAVIKKLIPKCFAWYCGLMQQVNITDVQLILWSKYPKVCPYCRAVPCNCSPIRGKLEEEALFKIAKEGENEMPQTLNEWLEMFNDIYGSRNSRLQPAELVAKVLEELGELSEAIRIEPFQRANLKNELADVLSWYFAVVNYLNSTVFRQDKINVARWCWQTYLDRCSTCRKKPCACPHGYVSQRVSEPGVFLSADAYAYDYLLPVYNRRKMDEDLSEMIKRVEKESWVASLIMIDIDDFKKINDKFGHPVGDKVLLEVAERIKEECMQSGDVYRYGGEEILILMEGRKAEEAQIIAENIRKRIEQEPVQHPYEESMQIPVTVSVGISQYPTHGTQPKELINKADEAMSIAKKAGKNRVVIHESHS